MNTPKNGHLMDLAGILARGIAEALGAELHEVDGGIFIIKGGDAIANVTVHGGAIDFEVNHVAFSARSEPVPGWARARRVVVAGPGLSLKDLGPLTRILAVADRVGMEIASIDLEGLFLKAAKSSILDAVNDIAWALSNINHLTIYSDEGKANPFFAGHYKALNKLAAAWEDLK